MKLELINDNRLEITEEELTDGLKITRIVRKLMKSSIEFEHGLNGELKRTIIIKLLNNPKYET